MNIINLTPHVVTIINTDGTEIHFPASGQIARCAVNTVQTGYILYGEREIPTYRTQYGEVVGLPDPVDSTIYIVSTPVAQNVPDRKDVLVPAETIRDAEGRIIGCRGLQTFSKEVAV